LLLAISYAGAAVYLNSDAFRNQVLQKVNAALDGRLTVEGHDLSLYAARLELSGVRLVDAAGEPLASVKRLRIRLFWPALLWRTIHIRTFAVEKAGLHARYDLADRLQLVMPVSPSPPADKGGKENHRWALHIDDFRMDDSHLSFQRPLKKWSGRVDGLTITAAVDFAKKEGRIQLRAGPFIWQRPEETYTLPSLNLTAMVSDAQTINVKVETPQSRMEAAGIVQWQAADPKIDLRWDLDVQPEEFQAFLPGPAASQSRLSARITAKGPMADPDVSVQGQWAHVNAWGIDVEQLEADLQMRQRRISIAALRTRGPWGVMDISGSIDLQPVFGHRLNSADARWEALTYDLKITGKDIAPEHIDIIDIPTNDTFQLQADIRGGGLMGAGAYGQGLIDVRMDDASPPDGTPAAGGHLTAKLQRIGPTLVVDSLQAVAEGNDLHAAARINFSTGEMEQAEARFKWTRLEKLGAMLGIQLPSGGGTLNLRCRGPFQRPTAEVNLLSSGLVLGKRPLGRLLAEARLNEQGILEISRMVLENQGTLLEGSGRMDLFKADGGLQTDPGVDLKLVFQQLEPGDFGLPVPAGNNFNGRIAIGGSLMHLTGQAILEESAVQWGNFAGRVRADARWDDGRLTIQDLNLFRKDSSIHLSGFAAWRESGDDGWTADPQVQARMQARNIELQDFFKDFGGTLALEARVSGAASDVKGQFRLTGTALAIGGQRFEALDMQGRLSADRIYCDAMEITVAKGQRLTSQGWYAYDRSFSVNMAAKDLELTHVAALQRAYPIEGRLDLRLQADGTIDNPQMNADLTVRDPRLNHQPWDDFHLTGSILGRRLTLTADLNFNLTADVRLGNGDFDLQAHFDGTDLSPYLALWAGTDWTGVLSGRLQARGNRHRPELIQAELLLHNCELRYQNQPIISAPRLSARLENGGLEVPSSRLALLQNGFLNLTAQGRLPADLRIESDGRLPMAALAPFVDTLGDTRGEIAFEGRAWGALNAMQWRTKLDFVETGFEFPGLGQQVEALTGRMEITPGTLIVQDLSGRMDGGRFTLNGQMQLKAWQPVGGQLTLNARAVPLQWADTMDAVLSGDLTFKGAARTLSLSGQLVLLEGGYYRDVKMNLLSAVTRTKRAVPLPTTYAFPGRLGETVLNVAVTHRNPLLVDNNLANLQIVPDLRITGTLARPILSGRAQVVAGEVIFRRKSFEVKRGVVDFINPYKIEPELDIVAEADIRQWRVSLSLSGTPDQLLFKLSSDPAESENDILSLILLGRTGRELARGEGGDSQTTRQMLTALIATAWGEDVKKQTGVDILEVETGAGEDLENADRVQVTVGKRLSRRLTVKYEVASASDDLVQRAISEYRFLEHLLASGFQDSKGGYGGELVFRIEF
jgi:autotransporter translocation and assembly factor TamB